MINEKKTIPRYIKIKLLKTKDKEQILKAVREKDKFLLKEEQHTDSWLFTSKNGKEKTVEGCFECAERKSTLRSLVDKTKRHFRHTGANLFAPSKSRVKEISKHIFWEGRKWSHMESLKCKKELRAKKVETVGKF